MNIHEVWLLSFRNDFIASVAVYSLLRKVTLEVPPMDSYATWPNNAAFEGKVVPVL